MDPIIQLLKKNMMAVNILGRVWELLYIEGSSPDIGKKREHFIRLLLEKEFGLKIISAPSMEREWDLSINIEGKEKKYSIKTTEGMTTVKVAWNGFPSIERARKFIFKYPILYVTGNRVENEISIFIFDISDLEELKNEMGDDMWWIPSSSTNPRGFGINREAIRWLINKAKKKDNYVSAKYKPLNIANIQDEYWDNWYNMLKNLALKD